MVLLPFFYFSGENNMFKTVKLKLENGTTKEFGFLAVGSTQYRYKQIFGRDLMQDMTKMVNSETGSFSDDIDFSVSDKLAFIMNCQAEKKDMNCQNFDTFLEWVDQFDSASLLSHMSDFVSIYIGNKASTSKPKKADEQ